MPPIAVALIASRAAARHSREQQELQSSTSTSSSSSTGTKLSSTSVAEQSSALEDNDTNANDAIHAIDRKLFVSVLKRRSRRARHCRTLPLSALFYALFIWAMLIHVDVSPSYDMERGLLDGVVGSFAPISLLDWTTWSTGTFLPALLTQTDIYGNSIPIDQYAWLPDQSSLVLGGITIIQRRHKTVECPLNGLGNIVYPHSCQSSTTDTTAPADFPYYNATIAEADGVNQAFTPLQIKDDSKGLGYYWFVSAYDDITTSIDLLNTLYINGWVDQYTSSLTVSLPIYNPNLGYINHLQYTADITVGGRIQANTILRSLPLNTYGLYPGLIILDIILILYLFYLFLGSLKRAARVFLRKALTPWERFKILFSFGFAMDWCTIFSYASAGITWGIYLNDTYLIKNAFSVITPTPSDGTYPPVWGDLQQLIQNASVHHASFKEATIWALIFLSLRMYKYVAFQARLAVLTVTFSRAWDDLVHFGLLFTVMFVCYGTWGHFAFGVQMKQYSNPVISITSMFQFLMYDYDLDAMRLAESTTADLYYASFMMLMTNLLLWMFLAVLFENYTVVRTAAGKLPSFMDEIVAFYQALPFMTHPYVSAIFIRLPCCSPYRRTLGNRAGVSSRNIGIRGKDTVTWNEVINVCTKGPLKSYKIITTELLRMHTGISEATASFLIADVSASSPEDSYYGANTKGAKPLPDALRSALVRLYPHLFPDEGGSEGSSSLVAPVRQYSSRATEDDDDDDVNDDEEDEIDPEHPDVMRKLKKVLIKKTKRGNSQGSSSRSKNKKSTPQHPSVALLNPVNQVTNGMNGSSTDTTRTDGLNPSLPPPTMGGTIPNTTARSNGGFSMRDVLPPPSSSSSSSSTVFVPQPYNVPVSNDTNNTMSASSSQISLNSFDGTSNDGSSDIPLNNNNQTNYYGTTPGNHTQSSSSSTSPVPSPAPVISSLTSANGTVTVQAVYHGNAALQQQQQQTLQQIVPNPFHAQ